MGIKGVIIPERTIEVGEGSITVRGIALPDLMVLVDTYGPQMVLVFQKVQQGGSLESKDVRLLIGSIAQEFPEMVAACMALAADSYDPDSIRTMSRLNFVTQLEVIEAIFGLTFTSEGEVKKLVESLTKMMAEVSGALTEIQLPSKNGTGESGEA